MRIVRLLLLGYRSGKCLYGAFDDIFGEHPYSIATGLSLAVILLQVAVGQSGQFIYFEF